MIIIGSYLSFLDIERVMTIQTKVPRYIFINHIEKFKLLALLIFS